MRYWYIESANFVLLQLIDKGYYDYDYEKVVKTPRIDWKDKVKNDEELHDMLAGFGFGGKKKPKKPETVEEIQEYIIKQEKYGS